MKGQTQNYTASKMVELLTADPSMTNMDLSLEIGVTRQRISQLRRKLDLPASPSRRINWHPCPGCGESVRSRNKYCSRACYYGQVVLTCETCGKKFGRSQRLVDNAEARNYAHTWCSKSCQGTWFGRLKRGIKNLVN
jgi:hypothetical protein